MTVKKGDLVQINLDGQDGWIGCILQVTGIKPSCITGFVKIPCGGQAYIRVDHAHYEKVGEAKVFEKDINGKIVQTIID